MFQVPPRKQFNNQPPPPPVQQQQHNQQPPQQQHNQPPANRQPLPPAQVLPGTPPPQPEDLDESNDLNDSLNSFSSTNEVVVAPPQQFAPEAQPIPSPPALTFQVNNQDNKAQLLGKPLPSNRPPLPPPPPPPQQPPAKRPPGKRPPPQLRNPAQNTNRPPPPPPFPTPDPRLPQEKIQVVSHGPPQAPQLTSPPPPPPPPPTQGFKFNPNKPGRRPPPPPPPTPSYPQPSSPPAELSGPRLRPRPNNPNQRPPFQPPRQRVPTLPETFTQDPSQISRQDIVTPNVPKVNYNFNPPRPVLESAEDSTENFNDFGNKIRPQENPYKERQTTSSVIQIAPDSTESQLFFVIETKIQAVDSYGDPTGNGGQILVAPSTIETPSDLLDPSFLVSPAPVVNTEVIDGVAPIRISQSQIKAQNGLDKEGWRTEGDHGNVASVIQPSTSAFDFSFKETEAPKTVTYANEWSTYEEQPSKVIFITKVKPKPSTNFEREWTTREDAVIKPSRQYDTLLPVASTAGYSDNNWTAFDSSRDQGTTTGNGIRVEKDANPAINEDSSSNRNNVGQFNFDAQRIPNLNTFRPSQEEGGKRPLVSRPIPPRPTFPSYRPPVTTPEYDQDDEKLTTPNFPPRSNGHGPNFRPSQPQDTTEPPVVDFPVVIGPQLPENGLPATPEPDVVVGRPPQRPEGTLDEDYQPLPPRPESYPTRPVPTNDPETYPTRPFPTNNPDTYPSRPYPTRDPEGYPPRPYPTRDPRPSTRPRRPGPPRRPPPPPFIPKNEYDNTQQFNQIPFRPSNNIRVPSQDVNSIDLAPETTALPTQSILVEGITDDNADDVISEETVPPTRPTPPEIQTIESTQDPELDSKPSIPIINDRGEDNIQVIEGTFAPKPVTPIISDFTRTVENPEAVSSTAFLTSDQVSTKNSTRIRFSIVNKPTLTTATEETTRETDLRPFSRPILTRPPRTTGSPLPLDDSTTAKTTTSETIDSSTTTSGTNNIQTYFAKIDGNHGKILMLECSHIGS